MLKRTITGALLVAVAVAFFFLRNINHQFFHILISLIAIVGSIEINQIMGEKTNALQKIVCSLASVFVCLAFFAFEITGALVALSIFFIILFFIPVFKRGNMPFESLAYSIFALIYPTALLLPLMLTNNLGDISLFALVLTFIISPVADVFAYLVGMTFKGKKLCPEISPKKTISGAIGGLVGAAVAGVVLFAIFKNTFNYHLSLSGYIYFGLVGLVGGVLTEIGDLVESYIKRSFGVKDSGKIFPGHGGMLDRFDGFIFASIFIYFVMALI